MMVPLSKLRRVVSIIYMLANNINSLWNISFEDAEDFLNYIRSDNNGSVLFERGWIENF